MGNKKDIGNFFREELGDLKQSPENLIWKDLEKQLDKKDAQRKRNIAILLSTASMALIILFITFKEQFNTNESTDENFYNSQITDVDCIDHKEALTEVCLDKPNQKETNSKTTFITDHNNHDPSIISTNKTKTTSNFTFDPIRKIENKSVITSFTTSKKTENSLVQEFIKKTDNSKTSPTAFNLTDISKNDTKLPSDTLNKIEEQEQQHEEKIKPVEIAKEIDKNNIVQKEKDTLTPEVPLPKKAFENFMLSVHAVPTYSFGSDGSLISDRNSNRSKSGMVTLGYGATMTVNISKKIDLRIGYNKLKTSITEKDIPGSEVSDVLRDASIVLDNEIQQMVDSTQTVNLTQMASYDEFSIGLGYKLIDKKVKASVIMDASLLILGKDNITLKSNVNDINLGKNDNLQSTSSSLNLGMNIRYPLWKNVYIHAEPIVKYQLRSLSTNSQSYRPFFTVLNIGLSYKF
ncbi:hypothetical protein [Aquimarina sp. SS2-1]|uniref:hypothetical protein n=1 Tax=Aquimarina besae TaxID=3342247 RepID=UPI0036700271